MPTPLYIIRALAHVRDLGSINMRDRRGVTALIGNVRAIEWLDKVSDGQYMEALVDMGAAESDDFYGNIPDAESEDGGDSEFWEDQNYTLSGGYSYEDDSDE